MKNHSEKIRNKIASLFLLTPLLCLAAEYGRGSQVYRVADDQDQAPAQAVSATNSSNPALPPGRPDISAGDNSSAQMPAGVVAPDAPNAPQLTWTTPAGWTEVPPSEMRVASFKVAGADGKQADVSVVPLPGMAGSDFANVNRWRGQVGLPAATDDELQKSGGKCRSRRPARAALRHRRGKIRPAAERSDSRRHSASRRHGLVLSK